MKQGSLPQILSVDEDLQIQQKIRQRLAPNCQVHCVSDLKDAQNFLKNERVDLMILEIDFEGGNGFQFCLEMKALGLIEEIPVVFFTRHLSIDDLVRGFEVGADDYIIKGLDLNEFMARIQARLRGFEPSENNFKEVSFQVDKDAHKIFMKVKAGQKKDLNLTQLEYKLLKQLLANPNRIFNREELFLVARGKVVHTTRHTIDTHISTIRKKMSPYGHYLKTISRKGYCFSSEEDHSKCFSLPGISI